MKRKVTRITAIPTPESVPASALDPTTLCPVARAVGVVGDRWTLLVLRELFSENHRFEEIQAQTGATPQMVAARLKTLEAEGMVERRIYNERPRRHDYHLTKKGEAFYPVILALRAWGETWVKAPKEGRSVEFIHRSCGKPAGLGTVCESCGEPLKRADLSGTFNPVYQAERDARLAAFRMNRGASR
jgi:DNA-binding HxlR family transcriptional regulator